MSESALTISNYFSDLDVSLKSSSEASKGNFRLDSGYYTNSESIIHSVETKPLSAFCRGVFMGPIFKRDEVENEKYGIRFLASNEIVSYEKSDNYITKEQAIKFDLIVKKGMILVTGYGTIGSLRIVDNIIDGLAIADNVTRIIPKENLGYIACFLSSSIGNKLLNDYAAGSAVRFIQAPQIAKIPVPVIDESIIESINHLFLEAVTCREHSHELLESAHKLVLQYNNLPPLSNITPETIATDGEVEIRMTGIDEFTQDYRLDAHFYNPVVKQVLDNIKSLASDYKELGDGLAEKIFYLNRFTRTFVEKGFGIPYMAGKDIIKIRPTDVSYLSYSETTGLDDYKLKTGWILMTCSGTLARTCYICNNYEDWVATHDLIRIVTSEDLDSGYLYAFLSTEYGYQQAIKFKHGAVIDHLTPEQIEQILIPIPTKEQQKEIGDLVRKAYELRAEAIKLEDEAQELLTQALIQA